MISYVNNFVNTFFEIVPILITYILKRLINTYTNILLSLSTLCTTIAELSQI